MPFQKWLSIGAIVKWQLEKAIPGLNVRLTILARSGDTLEKQHEALAGLNRRPELLIVYCGHNEFFSRFFAFSDLPYYFLDQRPSGWDRFVENAERLSPLCGLIRRSADQRRIALPPPPIERDLVDVPVYLHEEYPRTACGFQAATGGDRLVRERTRCSPDPDFPTGQRCGFRAESIVSAGRVAAARARIVPPRIPGGAADGRRSIPRRA